MEKYRLTAGFIVSIPEGNTMLRACKEEKHFRVSIQLVHFLLIKKDKFVLYKESVLSLRQCSKCNPLKHKN
jgi:hypothetical protein